MNESQPGPIEPAPTADEAAAIVAALSAYLAERCASRASSPPRERRWPLAARLAAQGQGFARGVPARWGNAARNSR